MRKDQLSAFLETYDKRYTIELIQDTKRHLDQHIEAWTQQMNEDLQTFFTHIVTYQKDNPIDLSYIHISFLYTSLYFKQPQFQLDSYDDQWLMTPSHVEGTADAHPLFIHIEDYRRKLQEAAVKEGVVRLLREEKLKVLLYEKVNALLYIAVPAIKYMAPQWAELEVFKQIKKAPEFSISIGAYRDWQRVIYGILPEVDIFYCEEDTSLRFRRFEGKRYKEKCFEALNLSHSTFKDCVFVDTTFKQSNFNDCVFDNCTFYHTTFEDTSFFGTTFTQCKIKVATWQGVLLNQEHLPPEQIKDLYKDVLFEDCTFEALQIKDSMLKDVQLVGCTVDASDSLQLLQAQEEGNL